MDGAQQTTRRRGPLDLREAGLRALPVLDRYVRRRCLTAEHERPQDARPRRRPRRTPMPVWNELDIIIANFCSDSVACTVCPPAGTGLCGAYDLAPGQSYSSTFGCDLAGQLLKYRCAASTDPIGCYDLNPTNLAA